MNFYIDSCEKVCTLIGKILLHIFAVMSVNERADKTVDTSSRLENRILMR